MTAARSNTSIVRGFVDAFNAADLPAMAQCLAEDLTAEVTERDGSTRRVESREAYMSLIEQLDLPKVRPRLAITQIAEVNETQVLAMIEVRAARKGRQLHNFAAYLIALRAERMRRIWMVEALPAESEAFWSA